MIYTNSYKLNKIYQLIKERGEANRLQGKWQQFYFGGEWYDSRQHEWVEKWGFGIFIQYLGLIFNFYSWPA